MPFWTRHTWLRSDSFIAAAAIIEQLDDGQVLTENIAILSMIADDHPALMAPGPFGRSRLLEILAYISTEIHKSFKPLFTPDR